MKQMLRVLVLLFVVCNLVSCRGSQTKSVRAQSIATVSDIPLLTFSDGNPWKTDFGSNFGLLLGPGKITAKDNKMPTVAQRLCWENGNPYIGVDFSNLRYDFAEGDMFAGLWISAFGDSDDERIFLPEELSGRVTAVKFRAKSDSEINLKVEAKSPQGDVYSAQYFDVADEWKTFSLPIKNPFAEGMKLKQIVFVIENRFQKNHNGTLFLDDINLVLNDPEPFPPADDEALIQWTKKCALRYFVWNYREPSPGRGVVLERNSFHDMTSIAGLGFAFPAFIVASDEGLMTKTEAQRRTLAMLNWINEIDCQSGKGGRYGFPYHFLQLDGKRAGTSEISTIDWAICTAGIRVAKSQYKNVPEIVTVADKLLARADWNKTILPDGLISHGFMADGKKLSTGWGSSYTEEAYLVALEAMAGGLKVNPCNKMKVELKSGFYPSWFGSGFTYNWLQLWTGPLEPFASNSRKAYAAEAVFCQQYYKMPIMGTTACEIFSGAEPSGFLKWDSYAGEIGSDVFLSQPDVIKHVSVCPYGAALAMPFARKEAIAALSQFVKLGAAHPLLGFADSLRMEKLPAGAVKPISNWTEFSIDVGPMWMAIEESKPDKGKISALYLKDPEIQKNIGKITLP